MLFDFSTDEEHCLDIAIQFIYGSSFTCLYTNIIAMHGMMSVFMIVFVIQTEVLYV